MIINIYIVGLKLELIIFILLCLIILIFSFSCLIFIIYLFVISFLFWKVLFKMLFHDLV